MLAVRSFKRNSFASLGGLKREKSELGVTNTRHDEKAQPDLQGQVDEEPKRYISKARDGKGYAPVEKAIVCLYVFGRPLA